MSEPLGLTFAGSRLLAGRYELGELVGRGGSAEVYRAHDRLLDRTVAVKAFVACSDLGDRRRFDDEAHALARLAHHGLVLIYDVGVVDDRPFLVMEFVEGTSLQSRLLDGPLPVTEVMRIGAVLAEALAHAHGRGVVHRDVKPSNIMLDREGLPHLTDFGIALMAGSPRLTSANEIVGTPAYLAPEQLSGGEVGARADVYALALVLLECVTGVVEYPAGSNLEIALSRLSRPPRIPADLPPAFAELLVRMTSTEPLDRPTAAQCALRLLALSDGAAGETTRLPDSDRSPAWWADEDRTARAPVLAAAPARSRRGAIGPGRRALVASVAGVAAVFVALVLLLNMPQSPSRQLTNGPGQARGGAGASSLGTRPAGGAAGGNGGSAHSGGRLVANQDPPPVATTRSSTPASSAPVDSTSATVTTTQPPTSTAQPTTTSSTATTTTGTTTTAPTTTSGVTANG